MHQLRRIGRWILGPLAILALAVVGLRFGPPAWTAYRLYRMRDWPALPLPSRPAADDLAEARAQDLDDLALLPSVDRSFSPKRLATFNRELAATRSNAATMSEAAFWMAVSRLVALADNGHTSVLAAARADRFNRAPIRLAWFGNELRVVRARPESADLLGCRIERIDGRSIEAAIAAMSPFVSGTAARRAAILTPLLESPTLLHAVWRDADEMTLTVDAVCENGERVQETVAFAPPQHDPLTGQPIQVLFPAWDAGWRTILQRGSESPLSLRSPERVVLSTRLPGDMLYLRIRRNGNDEQGQLTDQLARIVAETPSGGWKRIILDLRFNEGGDERKTAAFTRDLPSMLAPGGDAWVLVGHATFSAAIITAARVRHFLGARAHLAGETPGDGSRFWTDGGAPLVLRHSGIPIAHAWFLQDWDVGCTSLRLCMPYQFLDGVAAGRLQLDLEMGWDFADYAAGRDTLLEAVLHQPASHR